MGRCERSDLNGSAAGFIRGEEGQEVRRFLRGHRLADVESKTCAAQVADDRPRTLGAGIELAQFPCAPDASEQWQPFFCRRRAIAGDPLNAGEPVNGEQHIQMRDLALAVQVIEGVI